MELLPAVVTALQAHNVSFALIGAAALAARGVSRSTHDIDWFAVSRACLERDA